MQLLRTDEIQTTSAPCLLQNLMESFHQHMAQDYITHYAHQLHSNVTLEGWTDNFWHAPMHMMCFIKVSSTEALQWETNNELVAPTQYDLLPH